MSRIAHRSKSRTGCAGVLQGADPQTDVVEPTKPHGDQGSTPGTPSPTRYPCLWPVQQTPGAQRGAWRRPAAQSQRPAKHCDVERQTSAPQTGLSTARIPDPTRHADAAQAILSGVVPPTDLRDLIQAPSSDRTFRAPTATCKRPSNRLDTDSAHGPAGGPSSGRPTPGRDTGRSVDAACVPYRHR